MRNFLVALALIASACGATGIGSGANPSPSPPSAPSPTSGTVYDVTATNTEHAVSMHVGQRIEVVLRAPQGMNNWTHPRSSDPSVLQPIVDPAATSAIGVTLAAFQAVGPGQAQLTSNASPRCSPGQACPMYVAVYALVVTVSTR